MFLNVHPLGILIPILTVLLFQIGWGCSTTTCAMVKSRYIGDKLIPPLMTESLFHGAL